MDSTLPKNRRKPNVARLALLVTVAVCGSFLIPSTARAASSNPTQDAVVDILGSMPNIQPTVLHSALISATPNGMVGSQTSDGFTMHYSINVFGTTTVGWTIQPHTVAAIDNWIHNFPYTGAATIAAMAWAGAQICGRLLPGLSAGLCAVLFAIWQGYLLDTIHHAHQAGVCVTIKVHVPLFQLFDPYHPLFSAYPYVDSGSWCNRKVYITPPPAPNPQGPRMPGHIGTVCHPGDTAPVCL